MHKAISVLAHQGLVLPVLDLPILIGHPRNRHAADRIVDHRNRAHIDRRIAGNRKRVQQIRNRLLLALTGLFHPIAVAMSQANLTDARMVKISLRVINIDLRHGIPVDRNNRNLFCLRIHNKKKQRVRLPAVLAAGFGPRVIHVIDAHHKERQDLIVVLIDLVLVTHPAILPDLGG